MLSELSIENFAIIDRLLVRFEPGLTVLTGETGAGKSIIVDALQLVLGGRASSDLLRDAGRAAVVEAVFYPPDSGTALVPVLEEHGIESDESLILRRDISPGGRSSARVNGHAVPLQVLAALGSLLVDIHGQSDHLSVLKRDRQLELLDRYAGLVGARDDVTAAVREMGRLRNELDRLEGSRRETERRLDLLRFQVREIDDAALQPGEDIDLVAERNLLANAERLTALSASAVEALQGDGGALDALGVAVTAGADLAAVDPNLAATEERLTGLQYELEDLAQELRRYRDTIEFDPARLDAIEERLELISRLERKYGPSVADVIEFGRQAREELDDIENIDERLEALRVSVQNAEERAGELAGSLSAQRTRAAEDLSAAMGEALRGLGLRHTHFEAQISQTELAGGIPISAGRTVAYSATGVDEVAFMVSFNPGEAARPVERVASGGETSRFLLALKSVLAEVDRTPTLVFDEVDVGVGGRSGAVVGERLRELAAGHQVISITHLPQVAALADHHLHITKGVEADRTTVAARHLAPSERIDEIAEMMSGSGSEAARRSAQELFEAGRRS